jgi:hypothetical protein
MRSAAELFPSAKGIPGQLNKASATKGESNPEFIIGSVLLLNVVIEFLLSDLWDIVHRRIRRPEW